MNNLIWQSVTWRPGNERSFSLRNALLLPGHSGRQTAPPRLWKGWGKQRDAGVDCLQSGYALPPSAHAGEPSHPDCRWSLILIVARQAPMPSAANSGRSIAGLTCDANRCRDDRRCWTRTRRQSRAGSMRSRICQPLRSSPDSATAWGPHSWRSTPELCSASSTAVVARPPVGILTMPQQKSRRQ